jgi:hypothetical protein
VVAEFDSLVLSRIFAPEEYRDDFVRELVRFVASQYQYTNYQEILDSSWAGRIRQPGRFEDIRFMTVSQPVWSHLHRRSFTGARRKLYGYFHDKSMEVFAFQQNRFRFCNRYSVTTAPDAVFFLLAVWQQLGMDTQKDELHVVGTLPDKDAFLTEIRKFLQNAYVINPVADYNRAPVTAIKDIPYDLCALMMRS